MSFGPPVGASQPGLFSSSSPTPSSPVSSLSSSTNMSTPSTIDWIVVLVSGERMLIPEPLLDFVPCQQRQDGTMYVLANPDLVGWVIYYYQHGILPSQNENNKDGRKNFYQKDGGIQNHHDDDEYCHLYEESLYRVSSTSSNKTEYDWTALHALAVEWKIDELVEYLEKAKRPKRQSSLRHLFHTMTASSSNNDTKNNSKSSLRLLRCKANMEDLVQKTDVIM